MPTTNTRIADLRDMTMQSAEACMQEIAKITVEKEIEKLKAERKIHQIKADLKKKLNQKEAKKTSFVHKLEQFILHNPDKFKKPRAKKTSFGKFGFRKATSLDIDNKDDVLAFCIDNHIKAVKTTISLDKAALTKELKSGVDVPGAKIKSGETVFYSVAKAYIDQEKEKQS